MDNIGCIYLITNLVNNKKYVGLTIMEVDLRMRAHRLSAKSYSKSKTKHILRIDKAISKYGWENFKVDILEECPRDQLNAREIYWISELKTLDNKVGYNVSPGGGKSPGHTDEAKELIRQSSLDRVWITDGTYNHFYKPDKAEKFLIKNPNWFYGKTVLEFSDPQARSLNISNKVKGLIYITDGSIMLKVRESELDAYLSKGFKLGTLRDGKAIYRHYVTNGYKEYLVNDNKLESYIDKGYIEGKLDTLSSILLLNIQERYNQHMALVVNNRVSKASEAKVGKKLSKEHKKRISDTLKAFNASPEGKLVREKSSEKRKGKPNANRGKKITKTEKVLASYAKKKGKVFVTDGIRDYSINPEELEAKLKEGFAKGRHVKNSANTIWVNNGSKNCRILPELLLTYLSDGFVEGKICKKDIHIYCLDDQNNFLAQFNQLKDAAEWWLENGYGVKLKYSFYAIPKIKESADNNIIIKGKQWVYGDYGE